MSDKDFILDKAMCRCCGKHKALVNARLINGNVVTSGEQIVLGGNESYMPMCHKCWANATKNRKTL